MANALASILKVGNDMGLSSINNLSRTERWSSNNASSVVSPNWNQIPHKGMTTLSQDEIKSLVKDYAVQFENAASEQEKDRIWGQVQNLFIQYVSSVSPDRKSLYEQAIKTIKQNAGDKQKSDISEWKTLVDLLNEHDGSGKGMRFDKAYSMAGGGTVTAVRVTGGGAIFQVDYQGQTVLSIPSDTAN
ncbi:hypothetical protein SAMN02745823_03625 [Sporobacter termitidis DSM 10068]|uniref:Uncharacterized protein n=1 Tax=Sporobacter termitidis DSM 10068 TaxID=1123282 RepID=A0A1M5ZES3_9FIRM|nr:hypothetical protein [Sporobacter termitidis]SHI22684.1 hypothetical protein SAMN02745823_03625 [Sporobacter termitidis DSM 10068]